MDSVLKSTAEVGHSVTFAGLSFVLVESSIYFYRSGRIAITECSNATSVRGVILPCIVWWRLECLGFLWSMKPSSWKHWRRSILKTTQRQFHLRADPINLIIQSTQRQRQQAENGSSLILYMHWLVFRSVIVTDINTVNTVLLDSNLKTFLISLYTLVVVTT
jgi:hypothetical protein